ncbi:M20/M25/M40 family metallo-hydrolase, partial [Psychrobacter sp.]|uniref:M20/M25/M40 family metallo-hydrolase n=1 Tax=Psychrobacter sp. TaxID=56811 RepID=UPI0025F57CEA
MRHDTEYIKVLQDLISFDTTSYKSNLPLINYIKNYLDHENIITVLNLNKELTKANLFISTGPKDVAGILLSGHTDVVPADGQIWDTEPFKAIIKDNNIYGRGTADMKGFIACALVAMKQAAHMSLSHPLHLCLSYDEEIGCIGVRGILNQISKMVIPPTITIIGEPTLMNVATSHKGKAVFQVSFYGESGHSALAPKYLNAIHTASYFIQSLIKSQEIIAKEGNTDTGFDIPYSTIHVGKICGGEAINIVPNFCQLNYEVRNLAQDQIIEIQTLIFKKFRDYNINDNYDLEQI